MSGTVSTRARAIRRAVERYSGIEGLDLEQRRRAFERADRMPRPRRLDYDDSAVVGGVGAIVATPTATPAATPAERHVLYLHGGGYVLGSPMSHIALAARLAKRAAASITVIDYRLAPEHPYPAAIDDCLAAYRALLSQHDPASLVVAGDSAGGNAVLATMIAARDAGDPLPSCAYLLSPWTDLSSSGATIGTNADIDPMLRPAFVAEAALMYASGRQLDDAGLSPLFADLTGLPPMLIQTGLDEILLDDSRRLAQRASDAGVDVTLDLAAGMWHVYQAFAGMMPEADEALVRAAVFLRSNARAVVDTDARIGV
jgi:monoterpene epsilon-lactone hydrolase